MLALPGELAPPPRGNPGSATEGFVKTGEKAKAAPLPDGLRENPI